MNTETGIPPALSSPRRGGWLFRLFFPNRIGRLGYFLRTLLIVALGNWLMSIAADHMRRNLWVVSIPLVVYALFFLVTPRARDCGMSPRAALLMLIPGVHLLFAVALQFKSSVTPLEESLGKGGI